MEIAIQYCHFAIEVVIKGLGRHWIAIHCSGDTRWYICAGVNLAWDGRGEERRLTSSQTSLVNPSMHVGALVLELLDLTIGVFDLIFQDFNLVKVWSDGVVESSLQWVRCRHVGRSSMHCRITRSSWRALRRAQLMILGYWGAIRLHHVLGMLTCAGILGVFEGFLVVVVVIGGGGSVSHRRIPISFG